MIQSWVLKIVEEEFQVQIQEVKQIRIEILAMAEIDKPRSLTSFSIT
jgi:hypothetical protein